GSRSQSKYDEQVRRAGPPVGGGAVRRKGRQRFGTCVAPKQSSQILPCACLLGCSWVLSLSFFFLHAFFPPSHPKIRAA
ncbi:hypothetical protein COCMIDRAFT_102462, partial [Bipolaris oryzae ATCC 44560]